MEYRVTLALLSFGGWVNLGVSTTVQLPGGKDTTLSSRLAAAAIELQLITEHAGPAIRRPEKRHVSSLLREKRQETEYTSACTRILAKGTHNQGNTYPRVGGTHITVIHQGEQIYPGAWPGICVRGNRKSGGTHISVTPVLTNFICCPITAIIKVQWAYFASLIQTTHSLFNALWLNALALSTHSHSLFNALWLNPKCIPSVFHLDQHLLYMVSAGRCDGMFAPTNPCK